MEDNNEWELNLNHNNDIFERLTNRLDDAYDMRLQELGLFEQYDRKIDELHDKRFDEIFIKSFYEKFRDIIYENRNIMIPKNV